MHMQLTINSAAFFALCSDKFLMLCIKCKEIYLSAISVEKDCLGVVVVKASALTAIGCWLKFHLGHT